MLDDIPDDYEETPKSRKIKYPKCYIDMKHDGDPICKTCAKELYGSLPKKKFLHPRNCWSCSENGVDQVGDASEEYFE